MSSSGQDILDDLPDDVRELIAPEMPPPPELLSEIGVAIGKRRDEAKQARESSGIEAVWQDAEEAYIGIDDANRNEFQSARWAKPTSSDGPVTTGKTPANTDHKSTAFVRLTARYVDAGVARLCEILLAPDDKSFSFSEMPVPELIKAKDDTSQVVHDGMGNVPLTRALKPGETPPTPPAPAPTMAAAVPPASAPPAVGGAPGAAAIPPAVLGAAAPAPAPQVPLLVKDFAEEAIEIARAAAKAAEKRIYDWHVECQRQAEVRKQIFDAGRLGTGALKGPTSKSTRAMALSKDGNGAIKLQIVDKIIPASKWVDLWNCFPDPACGEDIHEGDHFFERDFLSVRQVRDLKKLPGYIASQIDQVLEEGPDKINVNDNGNRADQTKAQKKNRFEVWYYYGALKREEMSCLCQAAGGALDPADVPPDQKEVFAIVTLVNDCVIRATINPLDSGSFPYRMFPWQRRAGSCFGIGVGEQMRMPQKTVNAATRAMLNNAGKAAGSQFVIDRSAIVPADGKMTITPDKVWYKSGDSPIQDVRAAFMAIQIPNTTEQLMNIIKYGMQLAEECTSIPLVTQGQSGESTPDTLGATQIQDSNANQLLRSIGYAFDEYVTEPEVRDYYEWLLLDPDVPDDEKGEFTIKANGSAALVERAIQDQTIGQIAQMALNPVYGADPKKAFKLFLRSKHMDPADVNYTEEEQAKIDAAPPQQAPQVEAASITADAQIKLGVMKQTTEQQSLQSEQQIEQAANTLEGQKVQVKATVDLHQMAQQRELEMLRYANAHQISLDQAKTDLAKTAMTLNVQQQLNAQDNAVSLHKHHTQPPKPERPLDRPRGAKPLAQVPGKAPNGEAMAQT